MTKGANGTDEPDMQEMPTPDQASVPTSATVVHGKLIPPQQQILLFSPGDWEAFVQEWAHYQRTQYVKVVRFSGAGDMGIDVAGFTDEKRLKGVWDNYQCKHSSTKELTASIALPEIGKCLWHSHQGKFSVPRRYYFMASKGCGNGLQKLLGDPAALKAELFAKWDKWCASAITSTQAIFLKGAFKTYADAFDYSIFTFKTPLELIDEHRNTPYHAARFGGGLPSRPAAAKPPASPASHESRYVEQLFEAYQDHKSTPVSDLHGLASWPELESHYHRQREFFYSAESLRNFARDTVPPGTFESLQDEVHAGVIEVEASVHPDAYARMNEVTQAAVNLPLTSNGLISVTKMQDKRGICHQLANVDRLRWVKK